MNAQKREQENDRALGFVRLLFRSTESGTNWLRRLVEENRSALRKEWNEANAREENLRALRADLRKVMFMKI